MSNIAKIKRYCIANGEGLRTAVFFSGCTHKCKGCFNPELWDFNYGKPIDIEEILSTIDEHTAGLSLLGGDPLCGSNRYSTIELCKKFKQNFPDKTIWIWTGYSFEYIYINNKELFNYIDVLIDGPFIQEEYEFGLEWRGSRNQRILKKGVNF